MKTYEQSKALAEKMGMEFRITPEEYKAIHKGLVRKNCGKGLDTFGEEYSDCLVAPGRIGNVGDVVASIPESDRELGIVFVLPCEVVEHRVGSFDLFDGENTKQVEGTVTILRGRKSL